MASSADPRRIVFFLCFFILLNIIFTAAAFSGIKKYDEGKDFNTPKEIKNNTARLETDFFGKVERNLSRILLSFFTNDGTCGVQRGKRYATKCRDSACCSSSGFCGYGTISCGAGCQQNYGQCLTSWLAPSQGAFMAIPSNSFNAWAAIGGSNITGTPIVLSQYADGFNNNVGGLWILKELSQQYYFQATLSNKCLSISQYSARLVQADCNIKPGQLWVPLYTRPSDLSIQWKNVASQKCMDSGTGQDATIVTLQPCLLGNASTIRRQLWLPIPPSSANGSSSLSGLEIPSSGSVQTYLLNALSRHMSWIDNLPVSVDLRKYFVQAKDQFSCGSCSIFGIVAGIEGAYNIIMSPRKPVSFSEQEILNCNGSCSGSWPITSLHWVANQVSGLSLTDNYGAYTGYQSTCKIVQGTTKVLRYEQVPPMNEKAAMAAVCQQPLVAYLTLADEFTVWSSWSIFTDPKNQCIPGAQLSHVLAIVGYGTENRTDYWIVRNSFGPMWGLDGYARIKRGICGLLTLAPIYPILETSSENFCTPINPCGRGKCTILSSSGNSSYSCTCPPGYSSSNNTDGKQTCALVDVCGTSPMNPCSIGTCVNDGNGYFHCLCSGGSVAAVNGEGMPICITPPNNQTATKYTVRRGDTCYLIATAFGLTLTDLIRLNPRQGRAACYPLIPGDILNVTNPVRFNCKIVYNIQKGDSCKSISKLFSLKSWLLSTVLNPGLKCSFALKATDGLQGGQQVCIARGTPDPNTICTALDTVIENDIVSRNGCSLILARNPQISLLDFFQANRGIACRNLVVGQQVCVRYQTIPPTGCSRYYIWQRSDTCSSVIRAFCGARTTKNTWIKCMGYAAGLCIGTGSTWNVGRIICVSSCVNYVRQRVYNCRG